MLAIIFAKGPTLQEFCHCFLHALPCQESPTFSPVIGFYNAEYKKIKKGNKCQDWGEQKTEVGEKSVKCHTCAAE